MILATRNQHKVREMEDLLPGVGLQPLPAEVAIADDSGIEAADLSGAPGIYSARYAGEGASDEANLAKLLREVDANVVMTGDGGLVEVQATAERTPLSRASLDELLGLAEKGIGRLREVQERSA